MTAKFAVEEAEQILNLGVKLQAGVTVGKDVTVDALLAQYDAVFLGVGLGDTNKLRVPGENLPGVIDALDFIEEIKLKPRADVNVGRRVAVIGAGNTAIDAVAGHQLFNVVVDDDDVASRVVEHLMANKAGRVTMVPLSALDAYEPAYPKDADCRPLMTFLQYEPQFKKAAQQVFGRVLLCKDLDTVTRLSRSHEFTCVTLQGDTQDRKGAMFGGYVESEATTLAHMQRLVKCM